MLIPIAKFSVAVRGYTDDDADMLCHDLYIDFVSSIKIGLTRS
jgi:hypothetical protein